MISVACLVVTGVVAAAVVVRVGLLLAQYEVLFARVEVSDLTEKILNYLFRSGG